MSESRVQEGSALPLDYRTNPAAPVGMAARVGGWIMGLLPAIMLLMAACMNIAKPPTAVDGAAQVGFPEDVLRPVGVVLFACVLLYLIPRTAVLGAILLTGYLGGAVATHVRLHEFGKMFMAPVVAALLWGGLLLRDRRLRALLPFTGRA